MIPSEKHLVHERVTMFLTLLPHKRDSILSLDTNDLVLDWRPLWRILKKELWPLKRLLDPTWVTTPHANILIFTLPRKNIADIYLHLAEACRRFFPADQIKPLLDTFLPLLSPTVSFAFVPRIPQS